MANSIMRTAIFIAALAVIGAIVSAASRGDCERGDRGIYVGGMLIFGCPQQEALR